MPRNTIEAKEEIKLRKPGLVPLELNPQENFYQKATLGADMQLALSILMGYFGEQTKTVGASQFNELRVAQGGSGLNFAVVDSGSQPASYSASNQIYNTNGFLRFDVLVQGQTADIQIQKMDSTDLADITLPTGRYSFDFECLRVRIKYNSSSGGTYQLVGYRHDPSMRPA